MKKTFLTGLMILICLSLATSALAVDLEALDRVSVLMPKRKVLSLLGAPNETTTLALNLTAEIYTLKGGPDSSTGPLQGAGCIYSADQVLKGIAFMFEGMVAQESTERMKALGFALEKGLDKTYLLRGKDDDTGIPIVIYIFEQPGMTTVMVFEQEFYEQIAR